MLHSYAFLPARLRQALAASPLRPESLQEIRLRAERPVFLLYDGHEHGITEGGALTASPGESLLCSRREIEETLEYVSGYSMYAFDEEMKQGFLTIPGGHRIGLAGKIVADRGQIQCIRHIAFLNIRFSHEIRGCADALLPYLLEDNEVCHTLILSAPRCGKTTLLRDVIRQLSDGAPGRPGVTVGVVDERSELAGCYLGIPQNDLGMRTDVLDCCSKSEGMLMLLRSMSPHVIAVDELGSTQDGYAIESVFHCGCRLLATAHGSCVDDIRKRPLLRRMYEEQMFERYVVLGGGRPGQLWQIQNGRGEILFESSITERFFE